MTPDGERLTRAGAFARNADGEIVNLDGNALLDEGGGAIVIPFEAEHVGVASDGTISVNGAPVAKVGVVTVEDQTGLFREGGVLFRAENGTIPLEDGRVVQGFLEQSNVSPVAEMARMIAVQRAYEYGQKLMDGEDERIRNVVRVLGPRA
jgi:flagellar basal-body rod protein FlgF